MKLPQFFSFVPMLSVLTLLATASTGWCDRKITVYRDRDGDGHFNKKKIEIPSKRYHTYRGPIYHHRPYYSGYRYPYYGYGPTVSFNFQRSYSPSYSYSDDLAEDVQRELRRRGYYRGSIDGDIGPGTRAAIGNYQYDRGFPATGRIDRNLIRSLGID